ncbi:MAG: GYD domain-containing protein [Halolamina sp.]|uniref:GYD domain-containing protein n=1 Tax=Halolamina sp. TaxID=1940283 RepID=UPI002FC2BC88
MGTYMALVDVTDETVQNIQDLATIWSDLTGDIEALGGELLDAYAILGKHDYLIVFEAEGRDGAFQTSVSIERYGLDTQTMEIIPVEELGGLVDDI